MTPAIRLPLTKAVFPVAGLGTCFLPATLAVVGRYILTPGIFDSIRKQPKGAGVEIQLTDRIAGLLNTEGVLTYRYGGMRYDCGSR